ncbi:hypothetical protein Ddc_09732 [Ditylenchus destructor]|nr:hypothetical protein Ddc_09732 [Ditylenchus destructor]
MPSQLPQDEQPYRNRPKPSKLNNASTFGSDELSLVTDDVFSYMCSLAMEKCSKKSEKKKASCGGAAMRKRLLIKNFVAQMLAQERDYCKDRGINYAEDGCMTSSSDHDGMDVDMERPEEIEGDEDMDDEVAEEEGDSRNHSRSQSSRGVYEEEEQESDSDEESEEEDSEDDSPAENAQSSAMNHAMCINSSTPVSAQLPSLTKHDSMNGMLDSSRMTSAQSVYGNGIQSSGNFYETSRSCDWDDFHLVPPPPREYILEEENQCHRESFLYTLYPQYSTTALSPCVSVAGSTFQTATPMNVGSLPENLLDDMSTMWDEKKTMPSSLDGTSPSSDITHSQDGCALANLVTMVPPVRCCRSELSHASSYRRCITDLDSGGTVVEEDYSSNGTLSALQSPNRKRPTSAYGQDPNTDNFAHLMMLTTSPKRVKL